MHVMDGLDALVGASESFGSVDSLLVDRAARRSHRLRTHHPATVAHDRDTDMVDILLYLFSKRIIDLEK